MIANHKLDFPNMSRKRVLITGHTGFKGSWLSVLLTEMKCEIYGLSKEPDSTKRLYFDLKHNISYSREIFLDVADYQALEKAIVDIRPDFIFHLAAQSIVSESYISPIKTMNSNVVGTLNLLEVVRKVPFDCSAIIVTSDKCYRNDDSIWGYRECDPLGGHDPYSASKAAAEVVTQSYIKSFFSRAVTDPYVKNVATVRAGNVIGGGDFTADRIVVDLYVAVTNGTDIELRMPKSVRPWQHVLETVTGYVKLSEKLLEDDGKNFCGAWNFGPNPTSNKSVEHLVTQIINQWGASTKIIYSTTNSFHEAKSLKLSIDKVSNLLDWSPTWDFDFTVSRLVKWYKNYHAQEKSAYELCVDDLEAFLR